MDTHETKWAGMAGILLSIAYIGLLIWNIIRGGFSSHTAIQATVLVSLVPVGFIIYYSWHLLKCSSLNKQVPLLKSQLLAIRSVFAITLGFFAVAALFQSPEDQDILQDIMIPLIVMCFIYTFAYFPSSHLLHLKEGSQS